MGSNLLLEGSLMRQAFKARKAGGWAQFLRHYTFSARSSVNLRECHSEVEQADEDRKSIAQLVLLKGTDFRRQIIAPVEGQGGVTL